jgi:phosphoglycolate phosphatase-like HAD superfamily hydrolase
VLRLFYFVPAWHRDFCFVGAPAVAIEIHLYINLYNMPICVSQRAGLLANPLFTSNAAPRPFRPFRSFCHGPSAPRSAPTDVFVLDFDGVLADSEQEVSSAGIAAAETTWPHLFAELPPATSARLRTSLATVRPRLVRGYETMVIARLILEDPANVDAILAGQWEAPGGLLERSLSQWGEDPTTLNNTFESFRSRRAAKDPQAWAALSPAYPGVKEALADCPAPYYVASSKREDRLLQLLRLHFGLEVESGSPRVFAGLIPPEQRKVEALRAVATRPIGRDPRTTLHFIDDRLDTLKAALLERDVRDRWQLHLAAWGYCTMEEQAEAEAMPGVSVLSLPDFLELLRWGLVSGGVMDGCQATKEEAEAEVWQPAAERYRSATDG